MSLSRIKTKNRGVLTINLKKRAKDPLHKKINAAKNNISPELGELLILQMPKANVGSFGRKKRS